MPTRRPTCCPSSDRGVSLHSHSTSCSAACSVGWFPPWLAASVRLTGTKYGCGGGGCGACTVMVSRYLPTTKTIAYPLGTNWGSRSGLDHRGKQWFPVRRQMWESKVREHFTQHCGFTQHWSYIPNSSYDNNNNDNNYNEKFAITIIIQEKTDLIF